MSAAIAFESAIFASAVSARSIAAAVFKIKSICKKLKDDFGWSKEKRNYFMESVAANFKNKSKWTIFVDIWDYMTG